jgi:hypothetical protein
MGHFMKTLGGAVSTVLYPDKPHFLLDAAGFLLPVVARDITLQYDWDGRWK